MEETISEVSILEWFVSSKVLLWPLETQNPKTHVKRDGGEIDALIDVSLPPDQGSYAFVVEVKSRSTPEAILQAAHKAKMFARNQEWPMIVVPYLSPSRIMSLKDLGVSGIDRCGNGIVIVPGRICVVHVGNSNRFPDSRPLHNPYRGRSALVARMLLTVPHWPSLSTLVHAIREGGEELSLPQASKAVRALEEELIVWKLGNAIALKEPSQLLDRLGEEWRPLSVKARQTYRLREKDIHWPMRLASDVGLNWSLTGTSSVSRYAVFSQGGPRQIAVSNLSRAAARLEGIPERVASFADVELIETEEPGAFFQCETDPTGLRWASRLQTWLDLQMGDARQQEAARDLRQQILSKVTP